MPDIKINTEEELMKFLKVVAQESLRKTMTEVNLEINDPIVSQYKAGVARDTKAFGKLKSEVDSTEETIDDADVQKEPVDDEANDAQNDSSPQKGEDFAGSFQDLLDAINNLRSGKSVNDDEIKSDLAEYYERLTSDEQVVLYTFLFEVSRILTGSIEGDEAQDPGDPPLNYTIKKSDDSHDKESNIVKSKAPSGATKDVEDTRPPKENLPISENSDISILRQKVRLLMER